MAQVSGDIDTQKTRLFRAPCLLSENTVRENGLYFGNFTFGTPASNRGQAVLGGYDDGGAPALSDNKVKKGLLNGGHTNFNCLYL